MAPRPPGRGINYSGGGYNGAHSEAFERHAGCEHGRSRESELARRRSDVDYRALACHRVKGAHCAASSRLADARALTPQQVERLRAEWSTLDDNSFAQPWFRGIGEITRPYIECVRRATRGVMS